MADLAREKNQKTLKRIHFTLLKPIYVTDTIQLQIKEKEAIAINQEGNQTIQMEFE